MQFQCESLLVEKILLTFEQFCGLLCVGGDTKAAIRKVSTEATGANLKSGAVQVEFQRNKYSFGSCE